MTINSVKDLAKMIKEKRAELGITQVDAAGICNVGVRFLSDLENAKPTLQIDKVFRVCKFFDIQIDAEFKE